MARSALARTAPCGQVWDTKTSKYPLLGAVWPCFDPFEILAETPSSCNIEGNESPPGPPATRTLEIRCNIDMTAANRHIFGRATRRKPRFLALPKTPLFNHLWVKTLFFQEKTRFSGGGTPLGALQHVHQGSAAATVGAHGLAKTVRRTVPYGFSCSSCAHMGRLAP